MLGVSARWLPIVLSVLAISGGNALAASGRKSGRAVVGVEPAAGGWLAAPVSVQAMDPRCSIPTRVSSKRSLLAAGMSPGSWRLLWLMLAACLLSYGQYWQAALARLRWACYNEQRSRASLATKIPIADSQIPTCMNVCQQAMRKMKGESDLSKARTLVNPAPVLDALESCPAPTPSLSLPSSSLLVFAQLGRGPPPVS